MDDLKLGQVITEERSRDAIHIAVMPVKVGAACYVEPGAHVGIIKGTNVISEHEKHIGIVDPFLPKDTNLYPGDVVWLFLYPNTITSLRHSWTHPSVQEEINSSAPVGDKEEAERWIRDFAARYGFDYNQLVDEASSNPHGWATAYGADLHSSSELGEDHMKFWDHLEVLTDSVYPPAHRYGFGWSCSC